MNLTFIDWAIMAIYFVFVLGIGFALKRYVKTSSDFFQAGRSMPAWVAGLAFISANLGAQEVIGMAASGAKYGIGTSHFYWVGAIPAMVFVGVFMMPFYYGSKARSVPEYLRLRFDEKTRAFNAISFAVMTVFSSGISMYAMARLIEALHLLDSLGLSREAAFHLSINLSAAIVLAYIFLGGLTSAIYNEVLQFFLIVAGFLPLAILGLINVGGWSGIQQKLPTQMTHSWAGMGNAATDPLGGWFAMVAGLGFVLSFGYWCTDFLVIQRAMSADSMNSARRVPLIAAIPKMFFPFLVILPGLIAVALPTQPVGVTQRPAVTASAPAGTTAPAVEGRGIIPPIIDEKTGQVKLDAEGKPELDYNMAIPNMLMYYFPTGLLGLGLTALLASFMSGMAGNVTAFNTVWTYDIYQSYIKKDGTDAHYLWMGHVATVVGVGVSILTAYIAAQFNNIMDLLQLIFAFVNAPLFATFLLGMFWKRTTGHAAFLGLIAGTVAAALHHGLTIPIGAATWGVKGGWLYHSLFSGPQLGLTQYASDMAQAFWTAIYSWTTCFVVTILVSLVTRPRPDAELVGLVYSLTDKPVDEHKAWYMKPGPLAVFVLVLAIILNIMFA